MLWIRRKKANASFKSPSLFFVLGGFIILFFAMLTEKTKIWGVSKDKKSCGVSLKRMLWLCIPVALEQAIPRSCVVRMGGNAPCAGAGKELK